MFLIESPSRRNRRRTQHSGELFLIMAVSPTQISGGSEETHTLLNPYGQIPRLRPEKTGSRTLLRADLNQIKQPGLLEQSPPNRKPEQWTRKSMYGTQRANNLTEKEKGGRRRRRRSSRSRRKRRPLLIPQRGNLQPVGPVNKTRSIQRSLLALESSRFCC